MELKHLLALVTLLLFAAYLLLSKSTGRAYLLFMVYLLPFVDLNVTNSDYGSITVFDALAYFMFFVSIKEFMYGRYNNIHVGFFFLLVSVLAVGAFRSGFPDNSLYNLLKFISVFIFVQLFLHECECEEGFVNKIVSGLKFTCLFAVAFALVQWVVGVHFTFYDDLNPNVYDSNIVRLPGFFQDPQMFAQFLSLSMFLCFIRPNGRGKTGIWNWALFLLTFVALLLTGGRSALIGMCAGFFFIVLASGSKYRVVLIACAVAGYLVVANFPGYFSMLNRQEGINEAFDGRHKIWNEALAVFLQHPLLGIGIGNYLNYTALHSQGGYYLIDGQVVYYGTENGYLKILTETGILGFLAVMYFVLTPVWRSFSRIRKTGDSWNMNFLIAAVVSWCVSFNSLYTLSDKRIVILLAIILSYIILLTKKTSVSNGVPVVACF